MPRVRQNIVTGEWVVVAPERAKRPEEYAKHPFSSQLVHEPDCRFCAKGEVWQGRIEDAGSKHIYVIPNKYPAFTPKVDLEETGHQFYTDDASVGVHEVIVLLNPHDTLDRMSSERLAELLTVMQQRLRNFEDDSTIRSFTPIYNHGSLAGASVAHPHAQFFGNALVPPRLASEFFGSEQYFHKHNACVFCDVMQFELKEDTRIITKNAGAVVFAQYAPRFPFETWIVPVEHDSSFTKAPPKTLHAVGEALHILMHQISKKLLNPSLNWYIHTARSFEHHLRGSYHWHIEVTPRLSTYGGYELGTDMTIETALPEIAARFLRH